MKFALTRYYPVDQKRRIVYLDAQRTKAACSQFRGCVGIHGEELSLRWPDMERSYAVQRQQPDRRGGAGRGQGRKPLAVPVVTIKVKIFATAHQKLDRHLESLKARSGKYISAQQFLSDLVLQANLNLIVPYVKNERGERAMAVITQEASDRLDELVNKVKAAKPDLFISRTKVLSAIIYQATRAAR